MISWSRNPGPQQCLITLDLWSQPCHLWEAFQCWLQDLITSPVMGVGFSDWSGFSEWSWTQYVPLASFLTEQVFCFLLRLLSFYNWSLLWAWHEVKNEEAVCKEAWDHEAVQGDGEGWPTAGLAWVWILSTWSIWLLNLCPVTNYLTLLLEEEVENTHLTALL